MAAAAEASPRSLLRSRASIAAWGLLLAGLLATAAATLTVRRDLHDEVYSEVKYESEEQKIKIEERLHAIELVLRGGAGMFKASDTVSRADWKAFVDGTDAQHIVPGLQGIGYAQVIQPDDLAQHVAAVRAEGFPNYSVHPAGSRQLYTSVVYLEPFSGRNLRAFGYDMFSDSVRRAAMEQARDSADPALSGKVQLVQETSGELGPGGLMYIPVYRNGVATASLEDRRSALLGWVYSPFRMSDMIDGVLADWEIDEGRNLDLHIYDGQSTDAQHLLFTNADSPPPTRPSQYQQQRTITFYGKEWLLTLDQAADAPGLSLTTVWWTLVAGIAVSVLLFALVLSIRTTRTNAHRIAQRLTDDLRDQRDALADSEHRWEFAVEGSGDGLWDWDVPSSTVFYSPRWKAMLGYTGDEIGHTLDSWLLRIHSDDADELQRRLGNTLEGTVASFSCNTRLRCKDGTYKWVLTRGTIAGRDAGGVPVRVIGTNSDISTTKGLENDLRRNRLDLEEAQRLAKVGSWTLDADLDSVEWSPALYELFGLDPSQPAPSYNEQEALFTPEGWAHLRAAVNRTQTEGTTYELELELLRPDGTSRWMLSRGQPAFDDQGAIVGLRGVVIDITERREAVRRIAQLGQIYEALSNCNAAMVHCNDEQSLFQRICEVIVTLGGMELAWIGLVDSTTGMLTPVAHAGRGAEYVDGLQVSVRDDELGHGPAGLAVREDRAIWVDDFAHDPRTFPWHARGAVFGWTSTAAIPLRRNGVAIGILAFYSRSREWFDDENKALLEAMATDISFALDSLHLQSTLVESEQRFRALVEQSIAGVYIVENRKIAYANPRFKAMFGYDVSDDLTGVEVASLMAPDEVAIAAEREQQFAGGANRSEATFRGVKKDGGVVLVGSTNTRAVYQGREVLIGLAQDVSERHVAEAHIQRYAAQLEHTFIQAVGLVTTLSEMRDPYTAGHEERVAELAVAIGTELGLSHEQLEGLRVSGFLHDVGKISVPTEILVKPTHLNEFEAALMRQHPQAGYDVLKEVDFPWPVALVALQHHERIDGSGYPQGLKGEEILLESRIVAVADVVESMESHRPYRPALGIDAALEEIERGVGTLYDERAVTACLRLYREMGYHPQVS